jgi:hypothetical protein
MSPCGARASLPPRSQPRKKNTPNTPTPTQPHRPPPRLQGLARRGGRPVRPVDGRGRVRAGGSRGRGRRERRRKRRRQRRPGRAPARAGRAPVAGSPRRPGKREMEERERERGWRMRAAFQPPRLSFHPSPHLHPLHPHPLPHSSAASPCAWTRTPPLKRLHPPPRTTCPPSPLPRSPRPACPTWSWTCGAPASRPGRPARPTSGG